MAMVVSCQLAMAIYLPSFAAMRARFAVDASALQLVLSVYLAVFAVTQVAIGPLADRHGRRRIVIGALVLFGLASLACALAPSFPMLLLGRAGQAVGACAGFVLSRTIVRDSHVGPAALRAMSWIAAAGALAPAVSPLIGGQLQLHVDWWASFAFTGAAALVLALVAWRLLPETGQPGQRGGSWRGMFRGYRAALSQRRFLGYLLNGSCATVAMYIFLAAAPELLLERRGVPVELFGWFTFSWAGMFVVASLLSGRIGPRLGGERMVLLGVVLLTSGGVAMALGGLAGATSLAAIILPLMLMGFGNGFTMPSSLAGAMGAVPATIGGSASAAIGIAQVGSGAILSWIAGHVAYPDQTPLGLGIALVGAVSLVFFFLLSRLPTAKT
jgi:DHA1 family bicyclomycin/chloramphenicol resistance-like MFS transporter